MNEQERTKEIKNTRGFVFYTTALFLAGVGFGYFILCPISINFFARYSLSTLVKNEINIQSIVSFMSGANPNASPEQFAQWLRDSEGQPNSYCSGNVFDLPVGRTTEEEVTLRRYLAKQVVGIITEADKLKGQERTDFVKIKMEALQQDVLAKRHA